MSLFLYYVIRCFSWTDYTA